MTAGLAIKSGLFPFHFWMPDTYGRATPASSGILSGVVSKAYILLLIKIVYRAVGIEVFAASGIQSVLLIFGIAGMIVGSVSAIRSKRLTTMVAYSSAAQIGYIYMGLGMGTQAALLAAFLHIFSHALPVSQTPSGTSTRPPPRAARASMASAKAAVLSAWPSPTPPKSAMLTVRSGIAGRGTCGISNGRSPKEESGCGVRARQSAAVARIAAAQIVTNFRFIKKAVLSYT